MAWTQTDIDNLKKAMASGVLISRHGDTMLQFRSLAEMQKLLNEMLADLNGAEPRRTVAGFSRGL